MGLYRGGGQRQGRAGQDRESAAQGERYGIGLPVTTMNFSIL